MFIAIIGDIIHSKEINKSTRNEVQQKLMIILKDINTEYENEIAAKFLITIGDEFQGLLSDPKNIFRMIDRIQFKMYPIKLRFGIGIGDIDTEINRDMAIGADGPAYHNARKMLEVIKLLEKGKLSGSANILIKSSKEEDRKMIDLINNNLQLCSFIDDKWTDKQRHLIELMFLEEKNQTEAANILGIAQSSVQRRLKSAGYYDYFSARDLAVVTLSNR